MGSLIGLRKDRRVSLAFHVSRLSHRPRDNSQTYGNMSQCVELGCQHGASPLWLDHGVCCHAGVSHWHCHVKCWHVVAVRSVCSHPGSSCCAWHTEPNQEDPTPILRWSRLGGTRSTCGNGGTNVAWSRCSRKWGDKPPGHRAKPKREPRPNIAAPFCEFRCDRLRQFQQWYRFKAGPQERRFRRILGLHPQHKAAVDLLAICVPCRLDGLLVVG